MTGTTNVSPPAGTTTIDSDLKIEVEILALAALRRIASDIARRIEGLIRDKNPRPLIVIIREDHLDDITNRALFPSSSGIWTERSTPQRVLFRRLLARPRLSLNLMTLILMS